MKKLIKLLFVTLFLLICNYSSNAQTYTTKSGYAGCITKAYLDKYIKYAVDKDYDACNVLTSNGYCFSLKSGVTVYLEDTSWGSVEIRPKGLTGTIWTVMEAISRD
jgi:hypothetical protein